MRFELEDKPKEGCRADHGLIKAVIVGWIQKIKISTGVQTENYGLVSLCLAQKGNKSWSLGFIEAVERVIEEEQVLCTGECRSELKYLELLGLEFADLSFEDVPLLQFSHYEGCLTWLDFTKV